ncbi:PD-(D/E)XK nuclease family protein [Flavobacterium lipolyticum]|uniref:PD-(D/E)XK nuclease family protein n=1 Tax=Flavobacterium lipolyticum TaxID=2893754 RepID=A0ABS8M2E9_9FLAO|nr:PD-(D/E)XK nuclease family protein [Flavobacterium sp. F-126]MCC9018892.1 PD-(D/E)XK nuclease family protein [Flavobacterium sp. F-126]
MLHNTNSLTTFLSKLSVLNYKYRLLENDKEQFNIFKVLHKETDEVRLHSRFISVLLSPESTHNKKETFLKLFLEQLSIENFDTTNVKVYPTESQKSEFKEIDILIINRVSKQAIIIENKIWAGDSNHYHRGQLEGYYDLIHLSENIPKENIYVLYLTLDGHYPTVESLGKFGSLDNMNGKTIDYEHEIQTWLTLCLQECISHPFLRESIIQYINLIKQMSNDFTNMEERLEIINLISSSSENMSSAKLLVENFKHVKWHTVWDFWYELSIELEKEGYIVNLKPSKEDVTCTTHFEVYKKSYEASNDYGLRLSLNGKIQLFIWNGTGDDWLYWGIYPQGLQLDKLLTIESLGCFNKNETEYWKYFDLCSQENIFFPDFSYKGTFNLIDRNYRKMMITEKIVHEINSYVGTILNE